MSRARSALKLLQDQLDGVRAWQAEALKRERELSAVVQSREARMDAQRRLDSLRRTQRALLERSDDRIAQSRELLGSPRVVIAHRSEWTTASLDRELTARGLQVIGSVADGAEALGIVVAEQPDLLIVEDRLPSLNSPELVTEVRRFAPATLVAAQVESGQHMEALLEVGAQAVFHRRVVPADIAEQVAQFLRDLSEEPQLLS